MADLIQPEELPIDTRDGKKVYITSLFPAIAGREIVTQYPVTGMPKIGEYKTNEELMLKLMAFVAVRLDTGTLVPLSTRALVDQHVPDFETLMRIEWAMMQRNCSFFQGGKVSAFLGGFSEKAQALITRMLTAYLQQSSKKN